MLHQCSVYEGKQLKNEENVCIFCQSAYLSVCLSVCTSACLPVCLSACLPVCLSACLPVCLVISVCLFTLDWAGKASQGQTL